MTIRVRQLGGLGKAFDINEPSRDPILSNCALVNCAPRLPPPACKPGEQPVLPAPDDCCGAPSCALDWRFADSQHQSLNWQPPAQPAQPAQPAPSSSKGGLALGAAGAVLAFVLLR